MKKSSIKNIGVSGGPDSMFLLDKMRRLEFDFARSCKLSQKGQKASKMKKLLPKMKFA